MEMKRLVIASLVAAPLLGCAGTQEGLPLIFGRTQTAGLSVAGSVPDQGAHVTLGFSDRNIAIVPTRTPDGELIRSEATENNQPFTDALSVLGQFEMNARANAEASAGLGTFFSTGLAARNLAEGFRDKLRGFGPAATQGSVIPKPGD